MVNANLPKITLYTHPQSRARIVRWMLEETGLAYETKVVEYGPPMKSPEFLALNPMGKVPTLRVGDEVVTEVAAICAYLADLVPEKKLSPALHDPARGNYLRWLFFVSGPFEAAMTAKVTKTFAEPQMAGYGRYEDMVETLKHAVSGKKYIAGDAFSAADLLMTANLRWYMTVNLLESHEAFQTYIGHHVERPAMLRANELDGPLEMPS